MKLTYVSDKKNGLEEKFFSNGTLKSKIYYKDNFKDGAYEIYTSNYDLSYLSEKSLYKNNRLESQERYYKNGQLLSRTIYSNGKKNGLHETYFTNGMPKEKIYYENGRETGFIEIFYENGQLKEKRTSSSREYFYTNGQLKEKYLRGDLVESYYENGNPK